MKILVLLFAALLVAGCGEKEQPKEQEKSESNPKEEPSPEAKAEPKPESAPESRELPPLPETVTAEFIMGLWAKPHDGTEVMEELKDFALKPGIWKVVRNIGPSKEEQVQRIEASATLKSVDRRFVAQEFSHDAGVQYSVITYDYETESYRWWELHPDGFINEFSGKRYWRNLMEWKSVRLREEDVQTRMRETVRGEKSFKATLEIKKGGELVAYAEDEATWVKELGPPEEAQQEVKPEEPVAETKPKSTLVVHGPIETAIRKVLNYPKGKLTKLDLRKVTKLEINNRQITDLKGIEKLANLKELELRDSGLTDVKSLEDLTQLEVLFLTENKLTNVNYIGNLRNLKVLALENNELTDVKGLEKLTKLEWLYLENNNLTKVQIAELQKALPNCKIYPKAKSK